jgi:hypothetical protein
LAAIAVQIHFEGDPDDLLDRFERARRQWAEALDDDYERPAFYAACKTSEGVAIVTAWESAIAHRAFGQGIEPYVHEVGLGRPARVERMRIEKLGWD